MALSPEGTALTESHRQEQAKLAAVTAVLMLRVWPILESDPENDRRWIDLVWAIITRQRRQSATLAAAYIERFRVLELGPIDPFSPTPAILPDREQVTRSMEAVGAGELRRRLEARRRELDREGKTDELALLPQHELEDIAAATAGAAIRHVYNGARETIDDAVRRDPRVVGYQRVTDGDPCFWCAMLASRGPVYRKDSFDASDARFHGPGHHKAHDNCGCSLEPVYREDAPWIGGAQEWNDLWYEATKGKSGKAAIREFRRAYEARRRSQAS